MDDALDFILGAAGAPAKFAEVGTTVVGRVLRYEKRQSRDMDGNLKEWDDGSPQWEIVITLQTDERDGSIEDDDGLRRLFVRGQMIKAIRDALVKASWRKDLVGGRLGVKYTGNGTPTRRGFSPPKLYTAKFEPPAPADDFEQMADDEPGYGTDEEPF